MKLIYRWTYYVWMLCLLFSSCRSDKDYPEAMQKAIACMESHPDSAKIYLASLDSVIADEPEETRMYHALLTTQANDKLYITHTSDSVMQQVVRFYDTYGDADKRMLSYLYLGSVYRDLQDAPRALHAYQLAAEAGQGSTHYQVLARIHYQIGLLFAYQDLPDEFMTSTFQSACFYHQAADPIGMAFAYRNIARAHDMLHQADSTVFYYDKALSMLQNENDRINMQVLVSEYMAYLVNQLQDDKVQQLLEQLDPVFKEEDAIVLQSQARIYESQNKLDMARSYYMKALDDRNTEQSSYLKCEVYRSLAHLDSIQGNYQSALHYLQLAFHYQDRIDSDKKTEAVAKVHSLYNYQLAEQKSLSLQLDNQRLITYLCLLIIILLVVSLLATVYHIKKKRLQAQLAHVKQQEEIRKQNSLEQLERNKQRILELEQLITLSNQQKETIQAQLLQLQKAQLESTNQRILMIHTERETRVLSLRQSDLYNELHEERNWSVDFLTQERIDQMQQQLDSTYNNFTGILRSAYPKISKQELLVCCLIKLEIPLKGIAGLINRGPSAVTNLRKKLYWKLFQEEGTVKDFDQYIAGL